MLEYFKWYIFLSTILYVVMAWIVFRTYNLIQYMMGVIVFIDSELRSIKQISIDILSSREKDK